MSPARFEFAETSNRIHPSPGGTLICFIKKGKVNRKRLGRFYFESKTEKLHARPTG